jgi:hypothetical protein
MNLNDTLLPVTPSMERYTIQIKKLDAACRAFAFAPRKLPYHPAEFVRFINTFMDQNDHDELGNWADIAEYAKVAIRK